MTTHLSPSRWVACSALSFWQVRCSRWRCARASMLALQACEYRKTSVWKWPFISAFLPRIRVSPCFWIEARWWTEQWQSPGMRCWEFWRNSIRRTRLIAWISFCAREMEVASVTPAYWKGFRSHLGNYRCNPSCLKNVLIKLVESWNHLGWKRFLTSTVNLT